MEFLNTLFLEFEGNKTFFYPSLDGSGYRKDTELLYHSIMYLLIYT